MVNVRLSDAGVAFLDAEAARLETTRSQVIRAALAHWATLSEARRSVLRNG